MGQSFQALPNQTYCDRAKNNNINTKSTLDLWRSKAAKNNKLIFLNVQLTGLICYHRPARSRHPFIICKGRTFPRVL